MRAGLTRRLVKGGTLAGAGSVVVEAVGRHAKTGCEADLDLTPLNYLSGLTELPHRYI